VNSTKKLATSGPVVYFYYNICRILKEIRWPKKPKAILSSDGLGHKYAKEGKFDY
jgi:hypothetical protein